MVGAAVIACSGSDGGTDPAGRLAAQGRSAATVATPLATATAGVTARTGVGIESFDQLDANLGEHVAALGGDFGFAVYLPAEQQLYAANGSQPFVMASVAKLILMLALLQQTTESGRALPTADFGLLERMIVHSDNDAADAVWNRVGGEERLAEFLEAAGTSGIRFEPGSRAWGDGTATPIAMAVLAGSLYDEQLLGPGERSIAFALLAQVSADQAWGASAAYPGGGESRGYGVKNGWLPTESGWQIASVAVAIGTGTEPAVVVAFATGQPAMDEAVETIESVAAEIGAALAQRAARVSAGDGLTVTASGMFTPTPLGLPVIEGSCEMSATLVGRPGAYRCEAGGDIFDPCFAPPPGAADLVVCNTWPNNRDVAVAIGVAGIVHANATVPPGAIPWFIELYDGRVCERAGGALVPAADVSFDCGDAEAVLSAGDTGPATTVLLTDQRSGTRLKVPVLTLWY